MRWTKITLVVLGWDLAALGLILLGRAAVHLLHLEAQWRHQWQVFAIRKGGRWGTRDNYIKFENASDQYLGRILSGLNTLLPGFAVMPPFFIQRQGQKMKWLMISFGQD